MLHKSELEKQFNKDNKLNFLLSLTIHIIVIAMNIGVAMLLRYFIEGIEDSSSEKFLLGSKIGTYYIVAYFLFRFLHKRYYLRYFKKALSQFKNYIFEKLLTKSIAEFAEEGSAKYLSAFSNDLSTIESGYLEGQFDIIFMILMYITASAVMIVSNPIFGLPVVIISLIIILISLRFGSKIVDREEETSEENIGFIDQTKDLLNGFNVIKSFKAEDEVLELFKSKNVSLESSKQKRRETATNLLIFADSASILVNIFILSYGFILAYKGMMSIGLVIASFHLGNYILRPVYDLGPDISNFKAARALIKRIEKAIEKREPAEKIDECEKQIAEPLESAIELKNLSVYYDDFAALKNVNLKFEKNKTYAVVGASGSGKSTILKAILSYFDTEQIKGEITYDGVKIKDIDLDSLYEQISLIQQDVFLFDSSIKNNITMFKDFSQEKLQSAVKKAGLDALIKAKGYDYQCGEAGRNLSGGEQQRISIARTLLRETPVLLADEPTGALDNETALSVEKAILNIQNVTKIIISHRFHRETLSHYDEIIVMNAGEVIERGSFEQLMNQRAYFYSLYTVSRVHEEQEEAEVN